MKVTFTKHILTAAAAMLLILGFSTCKKSSVTVSTDIKGKWANTGYGSTNVIHQYEFNGNDSVVFYSYQIDTVSKAILGYNYKFTGLYKVENSVLTMYNLAYFTNPTDAFGSQNSLVATTGTATATYTITVTTTQLSFYFTCGPSENCVPSPLVYYRQ